MLPCAYANPRRARNSCHGRPERVWRPGRAWRLDSYRLSRFDVNSNWTGDAPAGWPVRNHAAPFFCGHPNFSRLAGEGHRQVSQKIAEMSLIVELDGRKLGHDLPVFVTPEQFIAPATCSLEPRRATSAYGHLNRVGSPTLRASRDTALAPRLNRTGLLECLAHVASNAPFQLHTRVGQALPADTR